MDLAEKVKAFLFGSGLLRRGERLAIAVSGGKDSMALAHMLRDLNPVLFHINLGIGEYSRASLDVVRAFAEEGDLELHVYDLKKNWGLSVPEIAERLGKAPCAVCGAIKRYYQNRFAYENNLVLATAHTLDDIASFLVNSLTTGRLVRIAPVLPEGPGRARKVKPLFYIKESTILSYVRENRVPHVKIRCPFSRAPARIIREALQEVERMRPGSMKALVKTLNKLAPEREGEPRRCIHCGMPASGRVCSICRIRLRLGLPPESPASPPRTEERGG